MDDLSFTPTSSPGTSKSSAFEKPSLSAALPKDGDFEWSTGRLGSLGFPSYSDVTQDDKTVLPFSSSRAADDSEFASSILEFVSPESSVLRYGDKPECDHHMTLSGRGARPSLFVAGSCDSEQLAEELHDARLLLLGGNQSNSDEELADSKWTEELRESRPGTGDLLSVLNVLLDEWSAASAADKLGSPSSVTRDLQQPGTDSSSIASAEDSASAIGSIACQL